MSATPEHPIPPDGRGAHSLHRLVRGFAWTRIPSPPEDPVPYYRVAVDLVDGRKFWRLWISTSKEPGAFLVPGHRSDKQTISGFIEPYWHEVLPNIERSDRRQ